ncbi:hypothetical protein GBA52_008413 [Prunus armeniaca]|nr:hypothetical protein GBA52_008413 [Prunus armeniaca]
MVRELVFSRIGQTQTQAVVYGAAQTMGNYPRHLSKTFAQHESKPHAHPQPTVPVTIHLQPTIPAPFPHDLTTRSRNTSSPSKFHPIQT